MLPQRAYNFSPGPATLPMEVLQQVQQELLSFKNCGASIMEISHRSREFSTLAEQSIARLRRLMNIPSNYEILFMQGGATGQFSLVPMNLTVHGKADYANTGYWSDKAIQAATKLIDVNRCTPDNRTYTSISKFDQWQLSPHADYLHITPNETIHGVEFFEFPNSSEVPLVADMSSTICSRPLEVSRFGLLYAGAQKNLGPSGITLIIIRQDLLARSSSDLPRMFSYREMHAHDSMLNTPPVFAWYVLSLVLEWIEQQGGLVGMGERNAHKAALLYAAIDDSDFYHNAVAHDCRSWMNIPFSLVDTRYEADFLRLAAAEGLRNLKGHRAVGGMRASLYNAMPVAGVQALIEYMREFERRRG